jgi:hypothetical protein
MKVTVCSRRWNIFLFILSFLFVLWGCSSGGGSSSGGGTTGLTYTGLTSQATIDEGNGQALTEDALVGGSTSFGGGGVVATGAVTSGGQKKIQKPMKVTLMMKDLMNKIRMSSSLHNVIVGAVEEWDETVDGPDGGTADFSISIDTESGEFSGSITFHSYSAMGVTYDGSADFSGVAVFDSEEFQGIDSFTFDYHSVACTSFGASFTIDGTMAFADFWYNSPEPYVTMNMVYRDDGSGKTYKMEDFVIWFDFSEEDCAWYWIEGTFYHPDYGYVYITTDTWFGQYYGDEYPSEGVLKAEGESGAVGPTCAYLVIIDNASYEIYVDTDGDGDPFDYDSGILYWEEGPI